MRVNEDHIEENIYKIVTRADESFFKSGQGKGHWQFVDHTALVMLALSHREPKNSPWIQAPKQWLLDRQESTEGDEGGWNDEVFDTAISILALIKVGVSPADPGVVRGIEYLQRIYHANGRSNWEDEPWETSWSVLATYESGDINMAEDLCKAVKWLMGLQGTDGSIIAPHYTAYFVKIVDILKSKTNMMGICSIDSQTLERNSARAVKYLMDNLTEEILWTGEAWSNGQILWALASSDNFPFEDLQMTTLVVDWFKRNQGSDGGWCENDDTACAVLGLVSLLKGHIANHNREDSTQVDIDTIIFNHFRRMYQPPKLMMGKKIVQTLEDGTTTINFSPRMRRTATILFAIVSGLTVVIAMWEFFKEYLGW